MPNINTPFGFRPFYAPGGGNFGRVGGYEIPSAHAENIFTGDAVALSGTGRRIVVATVATGSIVGAFHGVRYVNSLGEVKFAPFWPTGTVATGLFPGANPEAQVHDDPNQEFISQVDGVGLAEVDVASTMDFVAGAGSTATGQSAHQLSAASVGASQQFRLIALAPLPDNSYGQFAKAISKIRVHQLAEAFAGA
jgi:hypothetical protein